MKDKLVTKTMVQFGLMDRLRILFGREVEVLVITKTEHFIGQTKHELTHVYAHHIIREKSKTMESTA